jgi:hypothetical protein
MPQTQIDGLNLRHFPNELLDSFTELRMQEPKVADHEPKYSLYDFAFAFDPPEIFLLSGRNYLAGAGDGFKKRETPAIASIFASRFFKPSGAEFPYTETVLVIPAIWRDVSTVAWSVVVSSFWPQKLKKPMS